MNISGSLWDLGDEIHGSVDGIVPSGSIGDVLHGVLYAPTAVLYLVSDLLWGFGS